MITAIKNTNSDLYKDLFAKASEVLSGFERTQTFDENKIYYYKDSKTNSFTELVFESGDKEGKIYEFADALTTYGYLYVSNGKNPADYNFAPELGITTLEEYYNWLPEIKRDSKGNPTVFTKLPLDEAHFEINPNTRAITIPADFKKNGIAVQGDDLAEVVYFMIDRYFDAMDLNNTEIYIEWETPKSKTGGGVKSVSETYLKMIDDENYPGKLIFGWAISDAITKDSGTLKFAVRFVQWNDEDKIVYSFNTLTAQATIHPNLGLDLENDDYVVDNCNDRLLERIEPSVVVGGAQAAVPYFLQDIVMLDEGYDIIPNHTDGTYSLSVVATADDTGAVSYVWKRSEIGEDAWVEVPGSTAVDFVELTEKEYEDFAWKLPENRIYHIERSDETAYLLPKGYYDLTDAATKAWFKTNLNVDINAGEIPHLFEKRSVLVVEKYGQYKAEARNRIFNSLTKASSKVATFKRPAPVIMDNSNQTVNKHIIDTDTAILAPVVVESVGDLAYQWYKGPEGKILSEIVEFTSYPAGSQIAYGEDYIRICPSNDQSSYYLQNVGEGGNNNTFYGDVRFYYPEGAVKFKETSWNTTNAEPDISTKKFDLIVNEHPGVDPVTGRKYILDWRPFAYYTPETKAWTPYGWNKPLGEFAKLFNRIQWFDENDNLLRDDYIEYQYASEDTFEAFGTYEIIPGATEATYKVVDEPGLYQLVVTRTRNRDSVSGKSIEYRVTNAPAVPVFTKDTYDGSKIITAQNLEYGREIMSVEWDNNIQSDEFYATWFLYRGDKGLPDLEITTQKLSNVFISEFNPVDESYSAIFKAAEEDVEGYYYAIIKNKLNGIESAYNNRPEQNKMFSVTGS